jgi:hypothetical protein
MGADVDDLRDTNVLTTIVCGCCIPPMTTKCILAVVLIFGAAMHYCQAVEYVVLDDSNPFVDVGAGDLVEGVGFTQYGADFVRAYITQKSGRKLQINGDFTGNTYTGITRVEITGPGLMTIKITRAAEINAVGPTSMLIIPENATGNYDIVVESSEDLNRWSPFHSQTVSSFSADRFFRARIVKKN